MTDPQLAGFSLLGLSVVLMTMKFGLHRFLELNVIKVMFVSHIFLTTIMATLLMYGRTEVDSAVAAPSFFLAVSVSALLIPVGGLIGKAIVPVSHRQRERFYRHPLGSQEDLEKRTGWFMFVALIFGLLLFGMYVRQWNFIPLLGLTSGQLWHPIAHTEVRRMASQGELGLVFGYGLRFFMPFLFAMGTIGLTYFNKIGMKLMSATAVLVALLYNAWATHKTPVAMLFLLAAMIMLLKIDELGHQSRARDLPRSTVRRARRIRLSLSLGTVVFAVLVILYPAFVYLFKPIGDHGLLRIFEGMLFRIFGHPAFSSYIAFEAFTYSYDFTYFADVKKLAAVMNWEYIDLSSFSAAYQGSSYETNAPPPAIGNFYAQGGWPVVIGGVLFASMLFQIIENLLQRMRVKTLPQVALYVLLLHAAFRFSLANFHTIFMTESLIPICLALVAWIVVVRMRFRRRETGVSTPQSPEISLSSGGV